MYEGTVHPRSYLYEEVEVAPPELKSNPMYKGTVHPRSDLYEEGSSFWCAEFVSVDVRSDLNHTPAGP